MLGLLVLASAEMTNKVCRPAGTCARTFACPPVPLPGRLVHHCAAFNSFSRPIAAFLCQRPHPSHQEPSAHLHGQSNIMWQ
jgi:hypothetical protein